MKRGGVFCVSTKGCYRRSRPLITFHFLVVHPTPCASHGGGQLKSEILVFKCAVGGRSGKIKRVTVIEGRDSFHVWLVQKGRALVNASPDAYGQHGGGGGGGGKKPERRKTDSGKRQEKKDGNNAKANR